MSSAYKNLKPKRAYRERAQPESREHLGLLEKKKDYKVRAKNYRDKQDTLNKLRVKASLANPEEFYFQMIKGKQK